MVWVAPVVYAEEDRTNGRKFSMALQIQVTIENNRLSLEEARREVEKQPNARPGFLLWSHMVTPIMWKSVHPGLSGDMKTHYFAGGSSYSYERLGSIPGK